MYKMGIPSLIIFIFIVFSNCNQTTQKQTHEDKSANDWIYLFDGSDTEAWRGFKQEQLPAGWVIRDGILTALGHGGDLGGDIITKDQFEDFELSLEWVISEGGNSGIFFHVLEENYPTTYATGPEYQILDDVGFSGELEEWQKVGANYAMHNAINKVLKPVGEWNASRLIVNSGEVAHWLNGKKIVSYELWSEEWKTLVQQSKWKDYPAYGLAIKGHLGLQDHGNEVKFREIKVRNLTDIGNPLFNGKNLDGWQIYGTEKWFVEKGELVCESGPDEEYGYLATYNSYNDFILRVEFKQESNGNSGVFFRSSLDGTKITGWQVEVAPKGNDTGGIYESNGRGWLHQIPEEKEHILKEGEWNELIIKVQGNRVLTWLNNEMMTDLRDEKIDEATGSVALQIHDGGDVKVRWKNIYLKEL